MNFVEKNFLLSQHLPSSVQVKENLVNLCNVAKSKSYARQGFAVDITSQGTGGDNKFSVINDADHILVEADDDFGFNESFTNY